MVYAGRSLSYSQGNREIVRGISCVTYDKLQTIVLIKIASFSVCYFSLCVDSCLESSRWCIWPVVT